VNPRRADYKQGYQVAAAFLDWACRKHDKDLVKKLDSALRHNKYTPGIWTQRTHKSLDDLWAEFVADLRAPRKAPAVPPESPTDDMPFHAGR
jgi:hypothetical protein